MQTFDQAHQAIHYPPDRRFRIWINHRFVLAFAVFVLTPVAIAWVQFLSVGLPTETFLPTINPANPPIPQGFPAWLRLTHFVNFFFLLLLVRSGLSILMDHPRLYWNRHCTPNTEWMRFTPLVVPTDRLWTAKDDARYISPLAALPGYRHTVGMARAWHFLSVYGFLLNGFIFIALLFLITDQWKRLSDSGFMGDNSRFLEIRCLLRHVSSAGRTERLLSIQSFAAAFILRGHFHHGAVVHADWDCNVPRG